jgi:hypothetical protein
VDLQILVVIEAIDSPVADLPAFAFEQHRQPTITVTNVGRGQFPQAPAKRSGSSFGSCTGASPTIPATAGPSAGPRSGMFLVPTSPAGIFGEAL